MTRRMEFASPLIATFVYLVIASAMQAAEHALRPDALLRDTVLFFILFTAFFFVILRLKKYF